MATRQQARHKGLYDRKWRGAELEVGDLVLVKQTAWKGRHKIQYWWEDEEYQVVDWPTPGVPVYAVKSIAGGRPRVPHNNLLLPLQGQIRQEDRVGEESSSDSEGENELPEVASTPHGRPRGTARPCARPTQQVSTPVVLSDDTHSMLTSPSFPEHISGDEDSSGDEEYTTPLTLNTACDPISADMPLSTVGAVENDSQSTINQQPSLEQSIPP